MQHQTLIEAAKAAIAARVYGPFRERGGVPGETSKSRIEAAARSYLWNRHVSQMPPARALELAAPVALRPHTDRRAKLYYGPRRPWAGGRYTEGRDTLRHVGDTGAAGLRFIGWSHELPGGPSRYTGWYCRADDTGEMLAGGVWQLPGRKGRARLVYGYAELESNGREMNPGSATLVVSDILESESHCCTWDSVRDLPELRDAAAWADGKAERAAEQQRDYDAGYQAGREAAELDTEAANLRGQLREILAELRAAKRGPAFPPLLARIPLIRAELCERVAEMVSDIHRARKNRDKLWDDCGSYYVEAWRAGFTDNAEGGFRRAVALGFAKPSDWQGPPESNPCGPICRLPVLMPDGMTCVADVWRILESVSFDGAGAIKNRQVSVDGNPGIAFVRNGVWTFKATANQTERT